MGLLRKTYNGYMNFKPFTNSEAWAVFKIGAFGETIGWTILISGIFISTYITPHNNIAIQFAGHMHGALFGIYLFITIAVSSSMNWSLKKLFIALLFSVPPYGTLLFEQFESNLRNFRYLGILNKVIVYKLLMERVG